MAEWPWPTESVSAVCEVQRFVWGSGREKPCMLVSEVFELVQDVVYGFKSGEEHLQMNVGNNIECFQMISIYNTDFGGS